MASRDYRYVGFKDEENITEIILYSLPKVSRARKERQRYLESRALSAGAALDADRVQGGSDVSKPQRFLEKEEKDKLLSWLGTIEVRVCDRLKQLSSTERAFAKEYYLSGKVVSCYAVAKQLGMPISTAKAIRRRVIHKLKRGCTSVYYIFCLWRAQDDVELDNRRGDLDSVFEDGAA